MQQQNEPSPSSRPSDEEIHDCLDIMTRTNKRARYSRQGKIITDSQTFMLTLVAYGRALAWLEEHDISFEYDSKRQCYIKKEES